jgi:5-methylcytosine-specific restriction protein A
MPTAAEFRQALMDAMHQTELKGQQFLDITAGELHATVGGYPGDQHRMPMCCRVMRMQASEGWGDLIVKESTMRKGATLRIRYRLPRPQENKNIG